VAGEFSRRYLHAVGIGVAIALWHLFDPSATLTAQVNLDWRAPVQCPSEQAARAEIERLLRKRLPTVRASMTMRVEIERVSQTRLRARIAVISGKRAREHVLYDADCAVLSRAAALIATLALDSSARSSARTRAPPPPTTAPTTPPPVESGAAATQTQQSASSEAEPVTANAEESQKPAPMPVAVQSTQTEPATAAARAVTPREPSGTPDPRARKAGVPHSAAIEVAAQERSAQLLAWQLTLGLGGGLTVGLTSGHGPALVCSVGLRRQELQAALRVSYAFAQRAMLVDPTGVGGTVALASAGVEAGAQPMRWGAFGIPLLAGIEGGFFMAKAIGPGLSERKHQRVGWGAGYVGTGVALTWSRRWSAALRVDGLVAMRRPKFALESTTGEEQRVFHRPAQFGVRVYLLLDAYLP
jgi:hypothetical protein